MAIYTVHEPDEAPDTLTRADRTIFVREGGTFPGFVFGPFFLLWHRLWFALGGYILVAAALAGLRSFLHLDPLALGCLAFLMHLFIGIEGNDLRRWALTRRGYRFADVVGGADRASAEQTFFERRVAGIGGEPAIRPATSWTAGADPMPSVIGMFPDGSRT